MRECDQIRERLARGEIPSDADQHLHACERCATRVAQTRIAQARVAQASVEHDAESLSLDALLASVEARIAHERGGAAWLRERSTRMRFLIAAVAAAAGVLGATLLAMRKDASALSQTHPVALGLYAACLLVVASEFLRPLHKTRRGAWAALFAPFALFVPWLGAYLLAGYNAGAPLAARHGCMLTGFMVAVPLFHVFRALDRGALEDTRARFLAVAGAALGANAALCVFCPSTSVGHLWSWHAPIGVGLLVTSFGLRRLGLVR